MTNVNFCTIVNSLLSRARGTDFVRLRPASASVRFLRNFSCPPLDKTFGKIGKIFSVHCPNPSLRRTNEVRPPPASVRLRIFFIVRCPNPSLRRMNGMRPPTASVRFQEIWTVHRPDPSFGNCPYWSSVRIRPLSSTSVRFRPPMRTIHVGSKDRESRSVIDRLLWIKWLASRPSTYWRPVFRTSNFIPGRPP